MLLSILFPFLLFVSEHEWLTPLEHDFGTIPADQAVRVDFEFKNTSEFPIFIDNVRTSCGCTAPDWNPAGIEPDSTGTITIEYDAKKSGFFRKRILVFFAHQRRGERLWITGEVKPAD